ncbi:AT-hook motif nuclear-localized protein 9 [Linum perenne]
MEPPPPHQPQQHQGSMLHQQPPNQEAAVLKRKRGRPRKYGPDGTASLALSPSLSSSSTHPGTITPTTTQKRGRGRPPGTGKKQQLLGIGDWISGSAGIGFTPHIITVAVGEDIATKIMSFSQQGPRAICILSANGAVSTVTLTQPSTSGGTVTYEGRFEILCLSGSYLLTDITGSRNRAGGLSVSLASPDGRVFGGGVGGMLIAASPVQVIVGSFIWGGPKTKSKKPEGSESGRGSEYHHHLMQTNIENPVSPTSVNVPQPSSQNLAPPSPAAAAVMWPGSRTHDIHHGHHHDIDLMRG